MKAKDIAYVSARVSSHDLHNERLYAVVTSVIQTRVSYIYASNPERAAEKWINGEEINYEYLNDEIQKSEAVSVVDSDGTETVLKANKNFPESKRKNAPELEL